MNLTTAEADQAISARLDCKPGYRIDRTDTDDGTDQRIVVTRTSDGATGTFKVGLIPA